MSLWLEKAVSERLEALMKFIDSAEGQVRVSSKAATLIPLYRAARTLDRVLFGRDYTGFRNRLDRALNTVTEKNAKDTSFDETGVTRKLLKSLVTNSEGFHQVILKTGPGAGSGRDSM